MKSSECFLIASTASVAIPVVHLLSCSRCLGDLGIDSPRLNGIERVASKSIEM